MTTNTENNFIDLEFRLPQELKTGTIAKWSAFSFLIVPAIIAAVKTSKQKKYIQEILRLNERRINEAIPEDYRTVKGLEEKANSQRQILASLESSIKYCQNELNNWTNQIEQKKNSFNEIIEKLHKAENAEQKAINKTSKMRELYKSIIYSAEKFSDSYFSLGDIEIPKNDLSDLEAVSPSILLKLHCMDIKDLRKAYRDNDKLITKILEQYSNRYTSKTNKAIYSLMVIALRAELQNVLTELKYEKLDKGLEDIKKITSKYLKIATDGNQSIANTLTKFIGEIEYLFLNAAKIEYNYYVKKEQARQEQLAIREQMKIEAVERKALEESKKRIEKEEIKFNNELKEKQEKLSIASPEESEELKKRILELQEQLFSIQTRKKDIINRVNGLAGNIYIISNLGAFGEDVFKIGMTRRENPEERVYELGNASVPFKFDIHGFIFSQNAPELETRIHTMLNDKRLNKVNLRKEFFKIPIDELEKIVYEIDPSAEFKKTMAAEEYRQSLSTDEVYTSDYVLSDDDEDDTEL